jgi:hypothetical protein
MKKRDDALIIVGVVGGAALIGLFIYFASKGPPKPGSPGATSGNAAASNPNSSATAPGPTTSASTATGPATPTPVLPAAATTMQSYEMTATDGANIALKVGDFLKLDMPHPAPAGAAWQVGASSATSGVLENAGGDTTSVDIRALGPGTASMQIALMQNGASIEDHTMTITVS